MTIDLIPAGDPDATSGDPVAANLAALRGLFPQAFGEGQIDFDVLRQLLGDAVDDGDEKYGLTWNGKRASRRLALTPSAGTLRPARGDSVDWDTTKHLMIEGDNLEVLKLLGKSYASKVKLIYIDPPYNTGSDFVYPDDYRDSLGSYLRRIGQLDSEGVRNSSNADVSGRFHTDWLNMIYPRLMKARDLLTKDGVLAISCDENELSNCLHLIEYLFGRDNIVGIFSVKTANQTEERLRLKNSDFLLIVSKDCSLLKLNLDRKDQTARCTTGNLTQTQPPIKFVAGVEVVGVPDGVYLSAAQSGGAEDVHIVSGRLVVVAGRLAEDVVLSARWSNPTDLRRFNEKIEMGYDKPIYNKFGKELVRLWLKGERFQPQMDKIGYELPESVWSEYRSRGSDEIKGLMHSPVFDYPKHTDLIKYLISISSRDDETILDFFAGSGTTGHAVMAQNATDGGNRRYILVQLPEPLDPTNKDQKTAADFCDSLGKPRTIAELTKERLRRAAAKVRADHPGTTADFGFRAYKLATSNLRPWNPGADLAADLLSAADNILPGRSQDDLLTELLLKQGIDLTEPTVTRMIAGAAVHALGGGVLIVCLASVAAAKAEAVADGIADWVVELKPVAPATIFFKDAGFENDVAKANIAAILTQRLGDALLKVRSL